MISRLTADHTNSTTTKTAMTDLDLALAANTVYAFEYVVRCTANAVTVGVQLELAFTGTVTRLDATLEYWNAAATKDELVITAATSSPQAFNPTASQGNVVRTYILRGVIEVGASGGTLTLRHGSETATLTTVQRGSYAVAVID